MPDRDQISDLGKEQLKTPENINAFIEAQIKQREPVKRKKHQASN